MIERYQEFRSRPASNEVLGKTTEQKQLTKETNRYGERLVECD